MSRRSSTTRVSNVAVKTAPKIATPTPSLPPLLKLTTKTTPSATGAALDNEPVGFTLSVEADLKKGTIRVIVGKLKNENDRDEVAKLIKQIVKESGVIPADGFEMEKTNNTCQPHRSTYVLVWRVPNPDTYVKSIINQLPQEIPIRSNLNYKQVKLTEDTLTYKRV
jgi:hypothetical protein